MATVKSREHRAVPRSMDRAQFEHILLTTSQLALILVGAVALAIALALGKFILAPISLAIVVGLMFGPVADAMERRGTPAALPHSTRRPARAEMPWVATTSADSTRMAAVCPRTRAAPGSFARTDGSTSCRGSSAAGFAVSRVRDVLPRAGTRSIHITAVCHLTGAS